MAIEMRFPTMSPFGLIGLTVWALERVKVDWRNFKPSWCNCYFKPK